MVEHDDAASMSVSRVGLLVELEHRHVDGALVDSGATWTTRDSRRPTAIGIGAATAGLAYASWISAAASWTMPSHTIRTLSTFGRVDQGYWRSM